MQSAGPPHANTDHGESYVHAKTFIALLSVLAIGAGIQSAQAQVADNEVSVLRCSALSDLAPAHAAALVYYIAGYGDATRNAQTQLAAGTSVGGGAVDSLATRGMTSGGGAEATLTLSAEAIMTACGQSPDSRVTDIITSQGGSGVPPATAAPGPIQPSDPGPATSDDAAPAGQ